jgi:hypothetical protein
LVWGEITIYHNRISRFLGNNLFDEWLRIT